MRKTFPNTGESFSGYYAAVKWLEDRGFSVGFSQVDAPTGVKKGKYVIEKWRNLSDSDIESLDGTIEDSRDGDVVVNLKFEID